MSHVNPVPLRTRLEPRDPHEAHRVSTPLELFFDLIFVVAILSAAAAWHHGLVEGHYSDVVRFLMVFFAIWWAWMNYTWFASAYERDDVVYRLLTFTIMVGALMLAAGVPDLFDTGQSVLLVAGYCRHALRHGGDVVAGGEGSPRGTADGAELRRRYHGRSAALDRAAAGRR